MRPTALVVTTVHWPDDTRIRERLIRTLTSEFDVVYAARAPGPSDRSDIRVIELGGGRLIRNLRALRLALQSWWDVLVLHDPETLPAGLISRFLRRKPVVFDVHEDVPATAMSRAWVPDLLRKPLSAFLGRLLLTAEKHLEVTLAESGYERLFRGEHAVFANHPDTSDYPDLVPAGDGGAIYVGDVTLDRGADVAGFSLPEAGAAFDLRRTCRRGGGSGSGFR